jgi:predicted RNA-binding Zn-ribbon protein involved in translation (DUF1610 family)
MTVERSVAAPDFTTYVCPECGETKLANNFWHSQPRKKDGSPRKCRRCELGVGKSYSGKPRLFISAGRGVTLPSDADVLYEAFPKVQKVKLRDWLEAGEHPSVFYYDGLTFIQDWRGGEKAVRILSASGKLPDGSPVPRQWVMGDLVIFSLTRLCHQDDYGLVFY